MLKTCSEPGCATIVMGGRCLEHERRPKRTFVRGRPFGADQPDTSPAGYAVATLDVPETAQLARELPRR